METASDKPSTSGTGADKNNTDENDSNQIFECNICLETAKDAVISMCGHLFCWPCLHQWLETRPSKQQCPVCKAAISRDKVIPLYGRGSANQTDPRDKIPPRPSGQRSESESTSGFPGFSFGDGGFQVSFGIGAFPFTLFSSTFHLGEPRQRHHAGQDDFDNEVISRIFLWIAGIFIVWILFT